MKVIEVSVRNQNEVDVWQILDFQTGATETLHEKDPIPEIGINQQVEVGELTEERGMTDPGNRDLARNEVGKFRGATGSASRRKPALPDHLHEESAGIKVIARGEFPE